MLLIKQPIGVAALITPVSEDTSKCKCIQLSILQEQLNRITAQLGWEKIFSNKKACLK